VSPPPRRSTPVKAPPVAPNNSPGEEAVAQTREEEVGDDLTRSGSGVANLPLREVKKIYIDLRGDAMVSELRKGIVESLSTSGVVTPATDTSDADALLRIVVSQTATGDLEATARLVNARGTVIWPKSSRGGKRYAGATTNVMSEIVKDLLSEIRNARGIQ
jgi:hypothetical protein